MGERRAPRAAFCRKRAVLEALGPKIGVFGAVLRAVPAPVDSGMLNIPEFARRRLGYPRAKGDRPAKVCIRRGGLYKNAGVNTLAAC